MVATYAVWSCDQLYVGPTLNCRLGRGRTFSEMPALRLYDESWLPSSCVLTVNENDFLSSVPKFWSELQLAGVRASAPPRVSRSLNAPDVTKRFARARQ